MPIDLDYPLDATNLGTLWQEVAAKVQDLALPGIDETDWVTMQQLPWLLESQTVPRILVCPDTITPDPNAGTNERDDVVYRFIITFIFANDRDISAGVSSGAGLLAYWHETVRMEMQNKSNSTWPINLPRGAFLRSMIPDTITPLAAAAKERGGLNAMVLTVAMMAREQRTA